MSNRKGGREEGDRNWRQRHPGRSRWQRLVGNGFAWAVVLVVFAFISGMMVFSISHRAGG